LAAVSGRNGWSRVFSFPSPKKIRDLIQLPSCLVLSRHGPDFPYATPFPVQEKIIFSRFCTSSVPRNPIEFMQEPWKLRFGHAMAMSLP
jgi:hypothetical protein